MLSIAFSLSSLNLSLYLLLLNGDIRSGLSILFIQAFLRKVFPDTLVVPHRKRNETHTESLSAVLNRSILEIVLQTICFVKDSPRNALACAL